MSGGEASWDQQGGPALLLALFSAAEKNAFLLLPPFSLSTQTVLPVKQFLGSTCILMSFISSLGVSIAVLSIFAVAVVIFDRVAIAEDF